MIIRVLHYAKKEEQSAKWRRSAIPRKIGPMSKAKREFLKELRERFKDRGICTRCFKHPARANRTQCVKCVAYERDRRSASRLPRKARVSTHDSYGDLLRKQGGVCAICYHPPSAVRRLAIDHNHETGKVRGLLCTTCNMGLGFFKDSQARLQSAVDYLEE